MLHFNTIKSDTLEVLKKIMLLPDLREFNLAGVTALALQIGHRVSFDLDFFGNYSKEISTIIEILNKRFNVHIVKQSANILILSINDIKIDFVNYSYPLIHNLIHENDVRLLSIKDIAAMKLNAICGRGKKRDFVDLYFLLKSFSLKEMITFYNNKFTDGSEAMVLRSLTYFKDADEEEDIILFTKEKWDKIKENINMNTKLYYSF